MCCNEYDSCWCLPGLMVNVFSRKIKTFKVEIFYNSNFDNYVLFISNSNTTLYEKHFIITKEQALEEAKQFVNNQISDSNSSVFDNIFKFLKGLN